MSYKTSFEYWKGTSNININFNPGIGKGVIVKTCRTWKAGMCGLMGPTMAGCTIYKGHFCHLCHVNSIPLMF